MKRVLIIGVTPPPIGGVSMHIQRFYEQYNGKNGVSITLLDLKKSSSIFNLLKLIYSNDIVHIHLSHNLKIVIAFISKCLKKRVVYTHHNIRIDNIKLFKLMMIFVDELILVNDIDINIEIRDRYKYHLIPSFLPSMDTTPLPNNIISKIEKFNKVVSTNCFQKTFINGKDLYGFDVLVEAFSILVKDNRVKNTLLVLVDPANSTREYIKELIKKYPLNKNGCDILYIGKIINFNELIKKSDITIRATRSDGDSLSIRESLFLKTPIIASDVTIRPKGTVLFKNEDSYDLSDKIELLLKNSLDISFLDNDNYGDKILDIYLS